MEQQDKLVSAGEYCRKWGISQAALTKRRLKGQVEILASENGKIILYYLNSYQNEEKRGGKR